MNKFFHFEVIHQSSKSRARVGKIHTTHGIIDTPGFVPVATNGSFKALDMKRGAKEGTQLVFCNTYHLLIHPGPQIVREAGGLHSFCNYQNPLITDSGGFQVFSLGNRDPSNIELKGKSKQRYEGSVLKISEEGVHFRSYRSGDALMLTPESSVDVQKDLGADIIIPLDELPANNITDDKLIQSLHRTHRWEKRSLDRHLSNVKNQAMYSVIHGGTSKELRQMSIDFLSQLPFDGHAIGGSLGKDRQEMRELLAFVMPLLPMNKPVHLLGIGDLPSIGFGVEMGIDTFDSSFPTKLGRHGRFLMNTPQGMEDVSQLSNLNIHQAVDPQCQCYSCQNYTRSYLCHLHRANELAFQTLGTIHNIHFMMKKMQDYRDKILNNQI
eukprot:TRINITY_DN5829_c0_g1_i1.p1 TRINITY_DN5829_c0_g1~~TRINITY_DN5829_c0_g1_i1.p1  ORF type:complete len:398 (+),score=61.38 TRINITY_DN5829_c0_g1_i1:52-1194(+)